MELPLLCLLLLFALSTVCVCTLTSGSGFAEGSSGEYQEHDVRLVGGRSEREGRVEVFLEGQWGTVCDDQWGDNDAEVVCRQLGFFKPGQLVYAVKRAGMIFGEEVPGPIHMDEVWCRGIEQKLSDCSYEEEHDCTHEQDAGVICPGNCTDGHIRLVDGYNEYEGRLEVCYGGLWGTVCDDGLDSSEAAVVCEQLGLLERNTIPLGVGEAFFGEGIDPILLDSLDCSGRESHVFNCSHSEIKEHDCSHSEDVGVFCKGGRENCSDGDIRLVGGRNEREGMFQICYEGVWGVECDATARYLARRGIFLQNHEDANVICRQLGFLEPNTSTLFLGLYGGYIYTVETAPILLEDVTCEGSEDKFSKCDHRGFGMHSCVSPTYVGIICPGNCTHGSVRVIGGRNRKEGRVEACFEGHWFPVNHDGWSKREAKVVCQQLQFFSPSSPFVAVAGDMYGEAEQGIRWSVNCNGDEHNLGECTATAEYSTSYDTAGVICQVNCTDEAMHSSLSQNQRMDICKHFHGPGAEPGASDRTSVGAFATATSKGADESDRTSVGAFATATSKGADEFDRTSVGTLATAISLPLVAILAVLVVIMVLLIVLVRQRKKRCEQVVEGCTNPLPLGDNIEELKASNKMTEVSKPGHKTPHVLVTDFCNPMQSLPHTYESLRGRNIWLSSPANSLENLAENCVDSGVTGDHAYAILEANGEAVSELPGHGKGAVEATARAQPHVNEEKKTVHFDPLHTSPSYDKLAKRTEESVGKESDDTGASPSTALELSAGEATTTHALTVENFGYDSLKPFQHPAELSMDFRRE